MSEKVHCLGVVVEDTFLFELDDSLANQFVDTGQRSRTQLSFALNRLGLVVISRVSIEFAWTNFVNNYVLILALRVISNISLRIFLKLPQQLRLALELPVQLLLRLWTLEHQILEFVLDNRKAKIHEGFLRFQLFLLRLLPGCLFVHIGLEIKVSLTKFLFKVHALRLDKFDLVSFLHDFHHFLYIILRIQIINDLYLALIVQNVLLC